MEPVEFNIHVDLNIDVSMKTDELSYTIDAADSLCKG